MEEDFESIDDLSQNSISRFANYAFTDNYKICLLFEEKEELFEWFEIPSQEYQKIKLLLIFMSSICNKKINLYTENENKITTDHIDLEYFCNKLALITKKDKQIFFKNIIFIRPKSHSDPNPFGDFSESHSDPNAADNNSTENTTASLNSAQTSKITLTIDSIVIFDEIEQKDSITVDEFIY